MKILEIAPYFIPYSGGQERYIYNLSKFLIKRGHKVHIITSNTPKTINSEIINGFSIERHRVFGKILRNPLTLGFFFQGKKIKEYDIIHTHNEHSFASLAALFYKKKYKLPLVLTCHGQLIFGDFFKDIVEKVYSKTIGKIILLSCDSIIVNSKDDFNYICSIDKKFYNKIYILHNAIDPEYLNTFNFSFGMNNNKNNIKLLYVGKLIKRKGLEWLIKAMNILKENYKPKDLTCILIGEGPDKNYFEKLIKNNGLEKYFEFKGNVTDAQLINCYKNSDIFILPSLSEVCPTVVLEAMYFGLPVITTDIDGVRDHFKNISILVPPKDEKKLAEAIIKLIMDPNLKKQLSSESEKLIKHKYTWDKVTIEYEKIYKKTIRYVK